MTSATESGGRARADASLAMRLSLTMGVLMLIGKGGAWWITGSAAILSDAMESVIHVVAVSFAAWSLRLSFQPASARYPYGLERISFFSAGFEGAMIVVAALAIIYEAVHDLIAGPQLRQLGVGTIVVASAAVLNGALGWYLIRTGRRTQSIILEANGKHVLTDCWTSFGVIVGLCLVLITGWTPFDPLCAIAVALNILYSGAALMLRSARGLLDYADPSIEAALREHLDSLSAQYGVKWHGLRFRETGGRLLVELHLLFPWQQSIGESHAVATQIETALGDALNQRVDVVTHLESLEDHDGVHQLPNHN